MQVEINGEVLHYVEEGSGPTLVLVHSLGTGSWLWAEQIRRWSSKFRVVAFDMRGHGRSTNNGGVTVKNFAADLHAALQKLGLLPAHFVGISMGGVILARLHEIDPQAALSFVIADSFATQGEAGHERAKMLEAKISGITMREYGEIYTSETLLPATPQEHHRSLSDSIGIMPMENYLQTVRAIFTEDARACFEAFRVPTLVVVGDKDQRTPVRLAQGIVDLVGGSELKVIADAAHLANLDNPGGFHAAVDPFLDKVAR